MLRLLTLATSAFAGSLVAGWWLDDVRGYGGFGLLVAAAAVAAAAALSVWAAPAVRNVARTGWLAAAIVTLVVGWALGGEAGDTVLTYAMVALGFPLSLVVAPLAGMALGGETRQPLGLALLWLALFVAGYGQWYVVLPKVLRRAGSG